MSDAAFGLALLAVLILVCCGRAATRPVAEWLANLNTKHIDRNRMTQLRTRQLDALDTYDPLSDQPNPPG